jgi:Uma2 family endonuclease
MIDYYRWRDFIALPEDDRRELIDGRLVAPPSVTRSHARIIARLIAGLERHCTKRGLHVLASGYRVRIDDKRAAMPDVQVLSDTTYRSNPEDGLEHGRPELIIEVVSPTNKAHVRLRKVDWYAKLGVPEYWIVDPDSRCVQRLVLAGKTYLIAQGAADEDTFRPQSFRGLKIDLAGLWSSL